MGSRTHYGSRDGAVASPARGPSLDKEAGLNSAIATTPALDAEKRDEFAARLFESTLGALDLITVYLGERLGLYRALWDRGASTSAELAQATGTTERYAREWLEQQAASAIVEVDDARLPARRR